MMPVYTIDHNDKVLTIIGYNSLDDATRIPATEGLTRNIIREQSDLAELSGELLLRVHNFKTSKRHIKEMKDRSAVERKVWALFGHKVEDVAGEGTEKTSEIDLTSPADENTDSATASNEGDETMAAKKRPSTKKAKAAKTKTKTERKAKAATGKVKKAATGKVKKAATGPRGEKTLMISRLLQRKNGCTRPEILEATGWPSISVQAIAKQCKLSLRKEKESGRLTRYYGKAKAS